MSTNLTVPFPSHKRESDAYSSTQKAQRKKVKTKRALKPDEYAKAVRGYSILPTGAGQNHVSLAEFLNTEPTSIEIHSRPVKDDFVVLYPLGIDEGETAPSPLPSTPSLSPAQRPPRDDPDADHESSEERRHAARKSHTFHDPNEFFHFNSSRINPQSCIIFLRGYMTASWINHIGARYVVDPEFFCRHLDFRPPNDGCNNFSIPALPSSSWHLIELPVMTLGTRMASKGPMQVDKIEELRRKGAETLESHHHRISKLASSGMVAGESMFRDFYVFDETHFATEQRISICMQAVKGGKAFSLLIWLDSGVQGSNYPVYPWSANPPESFLLPTILHRHMIALKGHLFAPSTSDETESSAYQAQSASRLPIDYGRSLRPSIMDHDAFYCLNEVFSFAASSHVQFLNLIDIKLDKYTSQVGDQELQSLPHLKYTKQILYHYIQKTRRILKSIENAKIPKWPKDESKFGDQKATIAAKRLEQDFIHLLDRATTLHTRTTEAITVLMSSISISENQKAMKQAQRVGRLTFLGFIFVPCSITTSFFSMNIKELNGSKIGLQWWALSTVLVTGAAIALFYSDVLTLSMRAWNNLEQFINKDWKGDWKRTRQREKR